LCVLQGDSVQGAKDEVVGERHAGGDCESFFRDLGGLVNFSV
jgi:hypothetical protein